MLFKKKKIIKNTVKGSNRRMLVQLKHYSSPREQTL